MKRLLFQFLFLGFVLMLGTVDSSAQLGGLLKNAVQKGVQKSIEKKVEKTAEQEMDKLLNKATPVDKGEQEEAPKQQGSGGVSPIEAKMMSSMGMNTNVVYQKQFSFTAEMLMEIESFQQDQEVQRATYKSFFSANSGDYAMDMSDPQKSSHGLIVFDSKNAVMLILNNENGNKSGLATPISPSDSALVATDESAKNQETSDELQGQYSMYKPTGRTKIIAGYSCKEYINENENGRMEIWTTRDIHYNCSGAYAYMGGMQTIATGGTATTLGVTMEMHSFNKQTAEKMNFYVKEIDMNKPTHIDISDYQVVGMGTPHPAHK